MGGRAKGVSMTVRQDSRQDSRVNLFERLHRHDPRDALHDLLILSSLLQIVIRLQAHPEFWSAAKQPGNFQAHESHWTTRTACRPGCTESPDARF